MNNAYSAYRSANVDTADQSKLIIIAYDVAIKHCKLALEHFEGRENIETRTKHLFKVQDAVSELMGSLKLEMGEIAQNLHRLYDYMLRRLVAANSRNERAAVEEVLKHLTTLREAWKDAIATLRTQSGATADQERKNITITG
ncbi:MAG: flagellar export chaperone FliS [Chitinivibrionales bacterium]|nr:flagellar export chaperone FliS [Chitinivibrionales bacterium]MBD3358066.1 flagellar export chaperone FliS [Chitinivibrionales bacterium]